jgi:hypothetical protein
MTLTSFLKMPDVAANLTPLRPKLSRKIPAQLKVQPRSNRYMLVGTAFDYLLRFELKRKAPHAVAGQWGAELAPGCIRSMLLRRDEEGRITPVLPDPNTMSIPFSMSAELGLAEELAERACAIVEKARAAVTCYQSNKSPSRTEQADVAGHAIRLAKLEDVYRRSELLGAASFEEPAPEDVEDLLDLLAVVPFESLLDDKVLLLNPTFGDASRLVGGTDGDLISGDLLVDFKTTNQEKMAPSWLDQLLGYFLLARKQREADPTFPEIKTLALYFCRHAYLWAQDTALWTANPEFAEIEGWFFQRARQVFGTSKVVPARRPRSRKG